MKDVLGTPGRREIDTLALIWAHRIAWAASAADRLDEVQLLSQAAHRYGVPLSDALDERTRQLAAPPVVPASRPQKARLAVVREPREDDEPGQPLPRLA